MDEAQQFGQRLKELRTRAGLTQRELAEKVGVDFSYLSKLENGVLPPPSEKTLLRLAEVLNADKDELFILAGRIPADIAELLKNREALELLRSAHAEKKAMAKKGEKFNPIRDLGKLAGLGRLTLPSIDYRKLARVAIAVILVIAVGSSLWFASPTQALEISFPSLPSSGTLGSTYTFTVKVDVQDMDVLPITRIDLEIYNVTDSTKKATLESLPLETKSKQAHTIKEGSSSGEAQVAASAASVWGYGIAYSYGYGYREPQGWGWHYFGTRGGYGYGQSPYKGATSITYTIYWTSPSGWPAGDYKVKVLVYGNGTKKFSGTSSTFTLSAAVEAPPPSPPSAPSEEEVPINEQGVFTEPFTLESTDGKVTVAIEEGTIGKTKEGEPVPKITILRPADPPEPPADANVVGFVYDLEPDGATFDPPITVTFSYNPNQIPAGVGVENLRVAFWDEAAGEWVELPPEDITIDPLTNTISARVSHFTYFSVIVFTRPATFAISDLTITPSQADIAEKVTISVTVTNSGDLAGSYEVTLKINNEAVSTQKVTLAGHSSEKVTFITVHGKEGSYKVDVNGLTGSFSVKRAPTPPIVIPPPVPTVTVPSPPPGPAPTPVPAPTLPPPPAPAPMPLWLIIALAVIVVGGVVLILYFSLRREY
ncbi:MAG TPA: helix-turn-helix domain-containing protein [Dehalococcoidia bacterium]|jgi:transcriptional regulator with XRE-family HTH domain|nr:helix-turn-helix domain-containing protein [Dehalococcoidia bacterium]